MTKMTINLGERSYPILIGKGLLSSAKELLNISGKALILTDSGVPRQYAQAVLESLGGGRIYTVPEGEGSKSLSVLEGVLTAAADAGLPVYEYEPRRMKKAICGNGLAEKEQIQRMVKTLLGLPEPPQNDAADALGLAICHAHSKSVISQEKPI